jgi:hypothetical protein
MSGSGNGATPVCPVAISLSLDRVDFARPEKAKVAASSPWKIHSATFIIDLRGGSSRTTDQARRL